MVTATLQDRGKRTGGKGEAWVEGGTEVGRQGVGGQGVGGQGVGGQGVGGPPHACGGDNDPPGSHEEVRGRASGGRLGEVGEEYGACGGDSDPSGPDEEVSEACGGRGGKSGEEAHRRQGVGGPPMVHVVVTAIPQDLMSRRRGDKAVRGEVVARKKGRTQGGARAMVRAVVGEKKRERFVWCM
ncbi:unnamed protein product [Closterium sp. Naga37s-1]|nr:unnamed protein product [Closterium sp. Naga37s-1]